MQRPRFQPAGRASSSRSTATLSVSLLLEIEMIVVSATWIEHRATAWALVRTLQILPDGQLLSAYPTQDCRLIPVPLKPDFDCMADQCVMAILTRIVGATALHLDGDDI
jgi:hypothetical protein